MNPWLALLVIACSGGERAPALVPDLAVSADTLAFEAVAVGGTATRELVVKNEGKTVLEVSPEITGPAFVVLGGSRFVVEPGAEHVVTVQFGPTERRDYAGAVVLASNDPDPPRTVRISGAGR